MRKNSKKSSKGVVVSTIVILSLVAVCVLSLSALSKKQPAETGSRSALVSDMMDADNTSLSKLLSREDETDVQFTAADAAQTEYMDYSQETAAVVYAEDPSVPAADVTASSEQQETVVADIVVVDNCIDSADFTEKSLMASSASAERTVTAAKTVSEQTVQPEIVAPKTVEPVKLHVTNNQVDTEEEQEQVIPENEAEEQVSVEEPADSEITEPAVEFSQEPEPEISAVILEEPEPETEPEPEIPEIVFDEPEPETEPEPEIPEIVFDEPEPEVVESVPEQEAAAEIADDIVLGDDQPSEENDAEAEPEPELPSIELVGEESDPEPEKPAETEAPSEPEEKPEAIPEDKDDTSDVSAEENEAEPEVAEPEYEPMPYDAALGQAIVNAAMQWVGVTPYVNYWDRVNEEDGGYFNSLTEGTDCSGFVHLICESVGIYVPWGSDAFQSWANIGLDDLMPGDIVVYRYGGHVAIYAGDGIIVHCSNEVDGTKVSDMWYDTPTGYVRVAY